MAFFALKESTGYPINCTNVVNAINDIVDALFQPNEKDIDKDLLAMFANLYKQQSRGALGSFEDLVRWMHRYPMITQRILKYQYLLRKNILGNRFWAKQCKNRMKQEELFDFYFVVDTADSAINYKQLVHNSIQRKKLYREFHKKQKKSLTSKMFSDRIYTEEGK